MLNPFDLRRISRFPSGVGKLKVLRELAKILWVEIVVNAIRANYNDVIFMETFCPACQIAEIWMAFLVHNKRAETGRNREI